MAYTRRHFHLGAYVANEESMTITSVNYGGGGPIVLVCPGVSGFGWDYSGDSEPGASVHSDLDVLARAGAVVCVGTFADSADGGSSWGNIYGRTRMDQAIAWLGTAFEADTSRIGIIGDSEGGVLGLNYTWRNTDTVKVCITRLTPPNVQTLYDANGLVAATIDFAFDQLGGWAANREEYDPSSDTNIALLTDIAGRVRMYYSTNDGLAPEADHLTLSAATGIRVTSVGAVDHDIQTTEAVDDESQASWIWTRLTA